MVFIRWALAAIALLITGCVTVDLPSIAHVHVGHAITGWNDTPGGRGLCDVAQNEAAVASEHAAFAVEGAREIFSEILSHSRRIDAAKWAKSRSLWTKLREEWAYFLLGRVDPWWARGRAKYLQ